jgi:acyl carrier protein
VTDHAEVVDVLFDAIDEVNNLLPPEQQLEKSVDTVLFGGAGKLDSLGLVTFIVAAEQKVAEISGTAVTLADEKAMSQKNSPFRTIGTLTDYIILLLSENT